jgi:hypothetical protein
LKKEFKKKNVGRQNSKMANWRISSSTGNPTSVNPLRDDKETLEDVSTAEKLRV